MYSPGVSPTSMDLFHKRLSSRTMDSHTFFNSTAGTPSVPADDLQRSSLLEVIISGVAAWSSVSTEIPYLSKPLSFYVSSRFGSGTL